MQQILPILYDLGFNAVHPVEPEYNDIFEVRECWRGRLAIVGNLPTALLARGSVERIEERVREYCVRLAPGGGYVMSSSGKITPEGPSGGDILPPNLVATSRAVHKYGRYGSLGQETRSPERMRNHPLAEAMEAASQPSLPPRQLQIAHDSKRETK